MTIITLSDIQAKLEQVKFKGTIVYDGVGTAHVYSAVQHRKIVEKILYETGLHKAKFYPINEYESLIEGIQLITFFMGVPHK